MIDGAQFQTVAVSASTADLQRTHADRKLLVSLDRIVGLSESGPDMLKQMQSAVGHELLDVFNNTELAFLMCGLGGVTGSLGAKLLSSVADSKSSTAIVLAATPFSAESQRRRDLAAKTMADVLRLSTLCIEFNNDMLSSLAPHMPMSRAFTLLNGIMLRPVMDICATASRSDISLLRSAVGGFRHGRFGLGLARGDERIVKVANEALNSPWFDFDLAEVGAAIAIYSAADPWDKELDKILSAVETRLPSAQLLWGSYSDPALGDRIRLSLVACRKG